MRLVSFTAKGYRSLRSVRFDLGQVTVLSARMVLENPISIGRCNW